jgi:cephalosporin hydroxylase
MNKFMEDLLDTPLRDILAIAQRHICDKAQYAGIPTQKCPNDFWVYQEIVYEVKPTLIVEIGNFQGGSAVALADIQNRFGYGRVIGVDINHQHLSEKAKSDPRITFITGDAVSCLEKVKSLILPNDKVLIIEDSSHEYDNTLNIMRNYWPLVSPGSYFIIEDGICYHGITEGPRPGPYEAVQDFLKENSNFVSEREREGFVITWNPNGYLRRKA